MPTQPTAPTAPTHPAGSPLISAADLRSRLGSAEALVLLDCRCDLQDTAAGERDYLAGHLPGARYADLARDLSRPLSAAGPADGGRHPLPDRAVLAEQLGLWGIGPDSLVVAYDAQGGPYAARAWWLLRWLGHGAVAVLDGGLAAWTAAGGALESGPVPAGPGAHPYPVGAAAMPTVTARQLLSEFGRWAVLDARAPERYSGAVEPLDSVAGHIPGALNRPFKDNLSATAAFKPPAQLALEFAELLGRHAPDEVVHQCGSGVTACHNLLAMEAAGLAGSRLYPGSWSEWSADPARPVARGS